MVLIHQIKEAEKSSSRNIKRKGIELKWIHGRNEESERVSLSHSLSLFSVTSSFERGWDRKMSNDALH